MVKLPIADVRANPSELVDEAVRTHQRVEVIKNGRRSAVIMSADDYDSLTETLEIQGTRGQWRRSARQMHADIAAGRIFSTDLVEAELRAKGVIGR